MIKVIGKRYRVEKWHDEWQVVEYDLLDRDGAFVVDRWLAMPLEIIQVHAPDFDDSVYVVLKRPEKVMFLAHVKDYSETPDEAIAHAVKLLSDGLVRLREVAADAQAAVCVALEDRAWVKMLRKDADNE